jgi:hypothetical protein
MVAAWLNLLRMREGFRKERFRRERFRRERLRRDSRRVSVQ